MWNPNEALPESFLKLPYQVYAGDPLWHPEGSQMVGFSFSAHNPYFMKNKAWVGVEDGKTRLAGFYDPDLRIDGKTAAYFGYWESMDELAPNEKLFQEFEGWAKSLGVDCVYGPINFSTFGSYRIRLNTFEGGAFQGEPYNPSYYATILEKMGYTCYRGYFSQMLGMEATAQKVERKRDSFKIAPEAEDFSFKLMDGAMMLEALPDIYGMIDAIFGGNLGYTPIPYELFAALCGQPYSKRLCKKTSVMVRSPEGELAGIFLSFPDYGPLVAQGHPEAKPMSEITFDADFDRLETKSLLMKTVGVSPKFRRLGLHNKMLLHMVEEGNKHYVNGVGALISDGNPSARFFSDITNELRRYGLYVKDIT